MKYFVEIKNLAGKTIANFDIEPTIYCDAIEWMSTTLNGFQVCGVSDGEYLVNLFSEGSTESHCVQNVKITSQIVKII